MHFQNSKLPVHLQFGQHILRFFPSIIKKYHAISAVFMKEIQAAAGDSFESNIDDGRVCHRPSAAHSRCVPLGDKPPVALHATSVQHVTIQNRCPSLNPFVRPPDRRSTTRCQSIESSTINGMRERTLGTPQHWTDLIVRLKFICTGGGESGDGASRLE